jgi:hypothetical protein
MSHVTYIHTTRFYDFSGSTCKIYSMQGTYVSLVIKTHEKIHYKSHRRKVQDPFKKICTRVRTITITFSFIKTHKIFKRKT